MFDTTTIGVLPSPSQIDHVISRKEREIHIEYRLIFLLVDITRIFEPDDLGAIDRIPLVVKKLPTLFLEPIDVLLIAREIIRLGYRGRYVYAYRIWVR